MLKQKLDAIHQAEGEAAALIEEAQTRVDAIQRRAHAAAAEAAKRRIADVEQQTAAVRDALLAEAAAETKELLDGVEARAQAVRAEAQTHFDRAVSSVVSRATGGLVT